jgi:hypothetical protein
MRGTVSVANEGLRASRIFRYAGAIAGAAEKCIVTGPLMQQL